MKIVVCLLTHHQGSCFSYEYKLLLDVLYASFSAPKCGWIFVLLLVNGTSTMLLTSAQNIYAFIAYALLFVFCNEA